MAAGITGKITGNHEGLPQRELPQRFKNKYRVESHRMPGWDYSGNGYYFITLVTQNRECNLGEIINEKMILSDFGKIVDTEWEKSFEIRNELFCDEYIIMPNHLHAIVIIKKSKNDDDLNIIHGMNNTNGSHDSNVETHGRASLQNQPFYRKPKSLSSFIGGFKSIVNTKIDNFIDDNNLDIPKYNRNHHFFQQNYYDHIIRDENEYNRISQYIINNPIKWRNDNLNGGKGNIVMEPIPEYNSEIWMI